MPELDHAFATEELDEERESPRFATHRAAAAHTARTGLSERLLLLRARSEAEARRRTECAEAEADATEPAKC